MNPLDPNSYGIPPQLQEVSHSGVRRSFKDPSNYHRTHPNSSFADDPYVYSSQPEYVFPLSDGQENFDTKYRWPDNSSVSLIDDRCQTAQWTRQGAMESFGSTSVSAEDFSEVAFTKIESHGRREGRPRNHSDFEVSQSPKDKRREQVRNAQRAFRIRQKEHTALLTSQLGARTAQLTNAMKRIELLESFCRNSGVEYPPWDLGGSNKELDGSSEERS